MKTPLLLLVAVLAWSCIDAQVALAHSPQARNVALTPDGAAIAIALPGFGVVMRTRAEQPFAYLCDALLDHAPSDAVSALAFLSDGSLLLGTSDGVRIVAPNSCPAPQTSSYLSGAQIMGMAVHAGTDTAYVASAGDLSAVWRSLDRGKTWQNRSTLASAELITALRVSPDDPDMLYLSRGTADQSTLLVSKNGGTSFTSFEQTRGLTLLRVQAGQLWALARSPDNTTNRGFNLLRATAPQGPWTSLLRVNYFGGFTIDQQGVVWIGDESGGLYRSDDNGDSFVDIAPVQTVSCLAAAGEALWACSPGTNLEPALVEQPKQPKSSISDAFAGVVALANVNHLVDCSPAIAVPTRCAAAWVEWRRDVRMENLNDAGVTLVDAAVAPRSDAAVSVSPANTHDAHGGCSVRAVRSDAAAPSNMLKAWFGFALLVVARRTHRAKQMIANRSRLVLALGVVAIFASSCSKAASPAGSPSADGGASSCRASTECGATRDCKAFAPLRPLCGSMCEPAASALGCHADADCADAGTGAICGELCGCAHDGLIHAPHCVPGCGANSDCNPGESCSASHRCVAARCVQSSDCPANFVCRDPPAGTCAPKPCTNDGDCSGYCVSGQCSAIAGLCVDAVSGL